MGFPILDPMAGLFVSGVIIKQGLETAAESMKDLSDAPTTPQETEELRKTCLNVYGIVKVNQLFARKSGPFLYVECTVGVPGKDYLCFVLSLVFFNFNFLCSLGYISASAAHRLAELVKIALLETHRGRVANAVVHVEPLGATPTANPNPSPKPCNPN